MRAASWKILLGALFGLLTFTQVTASPVQERLRLAQTEDAKFVLIAAHRGGYAQDKADQAPENSVANVEVAIAKGFDVYETDIRRTSDGVFVIVHDYTLDRETNGSGPVEELTAAEVDQLRKRYRDGSLSDQKVATLKELLLAGKGRILFKPDLKPGLVEHFDALARLIHDLEMEDQVFLRTTLKDSAAIEQCFASGTPKVEVMFKVDRPEQVRMVAERFSPRTIQINHEKDEELTAQKQKAIQTARELGMLVETHSYSDPAEWTALAEAGVRMFHTAMPDPTLAGLQQSGWRQMEAAIALGTGRHLFLSDRLIDSSRSQGVERVVNPPRNLERVLKPDQPWEALGFIFYCSVVDHEGTAMLYYGAYDGEKGKHLCLTTSKDGLHWERPALGQKEFPGAENNNIFPMEAVEAGVFLDTKAVPEERFRLLHNRYWPSPEKGGVYLSSSADGIHWKQNETRLFPRVPDSQPSAFWDAERQSYAVYLRAWDPDRAVARVETASLDSPWPYDESVEPFHAWGTQKVATIGRELPVVMRTDDRDPDNVQIYTSNCFRYPWAEDAYLAFPAAYYLYRGEGLKDRALNGNDGTFDVQLAVSTDGIAWERFREPWVEPGSIDGTELQLVSMGSGMIRRGRELYQYFVGWPHTHGRPVVWDKDLEDRAEWLEKDLGGIYRATSRVDGFVSLDAGAESGTWTSPAVTFEGNELLLNIDSSGTGEATVAVLDEQAKVFPGLAHEDCEWIHQDAIDYPVTWKGGDQLAALHGQPVRLQVKMRNTSLYALQFRNRAPAQAAAPKPKPDSAKEKAKLTWTDPEVAKAEDPDFSIQGEYGVDAEGQRWGVQVVALGGGQFDAYLLEDGLPGLGWTREKDRIKLSGKREEGKVTLESADKAYWAVIEKGEINVVHGDSDVTLPRIERVSSTMGAKPPKGAVVLFDGSSADAWKNGKVVDGLLPNTDITTKQTFGSYKLHLEFRTPYKPYARGQGRGNSGVYHQGRYETQVLDSFGLEGASNEAGGIYKIAESRINMCYPPLTWQTYDVDFTEAKFDAEGKKTANARMTVRLNGVLIHEDQELPNTTGGSRLKDTPDPGPIYIQSHGNPVFYRNIWIVPE